MEGNLTSGSARLDQQPAVNVKEQKRSERLMMANTLFFFDLITSIENDGLAIEIYLRKINNK
jgi:hypothetical protein